MSKSGEALVLSSGGQDSATCLAWALDRFARVETLTSITGNGTASSSSAMRGSESPYPPDFPPGPTALARITRCDLMHSAHCPTRL